MTRLLQPGDRERRGAVLIIVLWISLILGLIVYSTLYELRLDAKLSSLQKSDMRAFYAARAGVSRAVVDLVNDMAIDTSSPTENYDSLGDAWSRFQRDEEIQCGPGVTYAVRVTDEEGKLNLNRASYPLLRGLLQVLDVEMLEAQRIAGAIVDWRDMDDTPYDKTAMPEGDYYAALQMAQSSGRRSGGGLVYMAKNDVFTTVNELLDVYGITPELFYGSERGRRRARARRSTRDAIDYGMDEREHQRGGLRDYLTVNSNGKLNVNTASPEVLAAIAVAGNISVVEAKGLAARAVGQRLEELGGENIAYHNIPEFTSKSGFPAIKAAGITFDVRSQHFTITALGRVYDGDMRGRASVTRGPRLLAEHSVRVIVDRQLYGYPEAPKEGDPAGLWEQVPIDPPYHKVMRENRGKPGSMTEPVVRMLQWIEW